MEDIDPKIHQRMISQRTPAAMLMWSWSCHCRWTWPREDRPSHHRLQYASMVSGWWIYIYIYIYIYTNTNIYIPQITIDSWYRPYSIQLGILIIPTDELIFFRGVGIPFTYSEVMPELPAKEVASGESMEKDVGKPWKPMVFHSEHHLQRWVFHSFCFFNLYRRIYNSM